MPEGVPEKLSTEGIEVEEFDSDQIEHVELSETSEKTNEAEGNEGVKAELNERLSDFAVPEDVPASLERPYQLAMFLHSIDVENWDNANRFLARAAEHELHKELESETLSQKHYNDFVYVYRPRIESS
jgi:hypothetical protein